MSILTRRAEYTLEMALATKYWGEGQALILRLLHKPKNFGLSAIHEPANSGIFILELGGVQAKARNVDSSLDASGNKIVENA